MKMNKMASLEKPREKMLRYGVESLSTAEVIAVILRTGTRDRSAVELAGEILKINSGGLRYLADCRPEEIKTVKGIGDAKVCQILAAVELGKRIASMPPENKQIIRCSEDIAGLFMEKLRHEKKEYFKCLLINAKGEIIEESTISMGSLTSSPSHPREAFANAIRRSAGSVVFVHNHPSGDPEPSEADIETTKRLAEVGTLLGIPVLDHVIIGDGKYVSMKARGMIS